MTRSCLMFGLVALVSAAIVRLATAGDAEACAVIVSGILVCI